MLGIVIGALPGLTATWVWRFCCLSPTAWSLFLACDDLRRLFWWCLRWFYHRNFAKIPGTPAAAATAIDGYELTNREKQGWH